MESLNDYYLVTIFELVEFTDQLALAQASRRFKSVLQDYIWSLERRYEMLDFDKLAMDLEQFHAYVTYVLPCVEMIDFINIPKDLFRVMIGHCFPNVQQLAFTTPLPLVDDQFMVTLSGIFPNLKTFCPQAHIKGECLVHFEKVENLILRLISGIELQHFIAAIRVLKLKSLELSIFAMAVPPLGEDLRHLHGLERLGVNKHELAWLYEAEDAAAFTHLREIIVLRNLTYQYMTRLFEFLCVFRGGNISYLEFNYCQNLGRIFRQTSYSFYARLKKMYFFNLYDNDHLRTRRGISTRFPALREIYFYECTLRRVDEVLKLLESDLELLNIEECTTYFKILRVPVERFEMTRQRPITLNFHRNFFRKSQYGEAIRVKVDYKESGIFKATDIENTFQPYGSVRIVF